MQSLVRVSFLAAVVLALAACGYNGTDGWWFGKKPDATYACKATQLDLPIQQCVEASTDDQSKCNCGCSQACERVKS